MVCGRGWLYTVAAESMLTAEQINAIHRLHWSEHWSVRKIARHFTWDVEPSPSIWSRRHAARLIGNAPANWIRSKPPSPNCWSKDAKASAMVIAQRLRSLGFNGGLSILKDYLHAVRAHTPVQRAYVRMEPGPGERFEIDWGHFVHFSTRVHARKLYAFCLVECHSRKLFVEFTHSQSFETFVRCHLHAFQFLGGISRESGMTISPPLSPNIDGNLVRFHPRFWPSLANTVPATRLSRAGGLGKRKNRESRGIFTAELLAAAHLCRFNRCQLAGATLARTRSLTNATIAKPEKLPQPAFSPRLCELCR